MNKLPRPLLLPALLVSLGLIACSDAPPAAGSHLGTPNAKEKVQAHLESLGHAVEGGADTVRGHLETLGTAVSDTAASVDETLDALTAAPTPPPSPSENKPRSYDAPPD